MTTKWEPSRDPCRGGRTDGRTHGDRDYYMPPPPAFGAIISDSGQPMLLQMMLFAVNMYGIFVIETKRLKCIYLYWWIRVNSAGQHKHYTLVPNSMPIDTPFYYISSTDV